MASGISWVWLITWSLWAIVVYKDLRRAPGDPRGFLSLAALVLIAVVTRDSLREPNLKFGLLSGLAIGILACWSIGDFFGSRRAQRLQKWADTHGFQLAAVQPQRLSASLPPELCKLSMLKNGRLTRAQGILSRVESGGSEVLVFRHSARRSVVWFEIGGVEAAATVVAIRRPGIWLPSFQIRPLGILSWMDGGRVGDAVTVPTGTSFANSFRLGGDEPRNLRAIFHDELLARIAAKPGWLIEGEGEWLAAIYFDRSPNLMSLKKSTLYEANPGELDEYLKETLRVLNSIADAADRSHAGEVGAA